jgi:hypothetical protein
MPARCVFCGSKATLTNAHVFSQPIRDALSDPSATGSVVFRQSKQSDGSSSAHSHQGDWRDVKARVECDACNGGWTSQIEQSVTAILPGLIRGDQTEFTREEQRALATWSVLTILLLQYTHSRDARVVIPASDYTDFYNTKSPAVLMKLVMSYVEPPGRGSSVEAAVEYLAEDRNMRDVARLLEEDGLPPPVDIHAYTATLRLGYWVVHLMRFGSRDLVERLSPGPGLRPYVQGIWPPEDTHSWPPRSLAEIGGIMTLARRVDAGVSISGP